MKKVVTIILDGFGISDDNSANAIKKANMQNFEKLVKDYSMSQLDASGLAAGLNEGEFGNSEVGHTLIGAGRLIKQNGMVVKDFIENDYLTNYYFGQMLIDKTKTFHIMGLCSDGKVHSNIEHFIKVYEILVANGITKIYFHLITDGRDTAPTVAKKFISQIQEIISEHKLGSIATVCGRYYAMDRDSNYERTRLYYNLVVKGIGISTSDINLALDEAYKADDSDEFLKPIIKDTDGVIKDGDNLIWMNYRADRAKQIISSLTDLKFDEFQIKKFDNLNVYSFLKLDKSIKTINFIDKDEITNPLGLYLADLNLSQARIAESEKYPHVTYFFDGGYTGKIDNCVKYNIPSPDVATYDLKPDMSAVDVTKKVIKAIEKDVDFILVNFANPDMVGHTGNMVAATKACMAVDLCLGKILEVAEENFYTVVLLADHGNADKMIESDGTACKTHTTSLVPFIIVDKNIKLQEYGSLINVAPTILEYMNISRPKEMSETPSLII